jgi:hypothetical protein
MSVLIIDETVRGAVAELIERARKRPLSWDKMRDVALEIAKRDDQGMLDLTDRPANFERPPTEQIVLNEHYRCAFSFEEQPAGFVRHLSVSVPKRGAFPNVPAIEMIAELFGFTEFPPTRGRIWLEEFEPGHHAVNIVEIESEREAGHA